MSSEPVLITPSPSAQFTSDYLFFESSLIAFNSACDGLLRDHRIARLFERMSIILEFLATRGSVNKFSLPGLASLKTISIDDESESKRENFSLLDYIVSHVQEDLKNEEEENEENKEDQDGLTNKCRKSLESAILINFDEFISRFSRLINSNSENSEEAEKILIVKGKMKNFKELMGRCM